jgi:hypothetical protein
MDVEVFGNIIYNALSRKTCYFMFKTDTHNTALISEVK